MVNGAAARADLVFGFVTYLEQREIGRHHIERAHPANVEFDQEADLRAGQSLNYPGDQLRRFAVCHSQCATGPSHDGTAGMDKAVDSGAVAAAVGRVAEANRLLGACAVEQRIWVQSIQHRDLEIAEVGQVRVVQCQPLAHNVQEAVQVVIAQVYGAIGQDGNACPHFLGLRQAVQAVVGDNEQPHVLQVLVHPTVGGGQVEQQGILQVLLELRVGRAAAAELAGLRSVPGQRVVSLQRLEDAQPCFIHQHRLPCAGQAAGLAQSVVDTPAEVETTLQVVDVGRLQRGILPAVGEGDDLALGGGQRAQRVGDEDVGGGGTAHGAEGEQFVELARPSVVGHAATGTQQQRHRHYADLDLASVRTVGIQPVALRAVEPVLRHDVLETVLAAPDGAFRREPVVRIGHLVGIVRGRVDVGRLPLELQCVDLSRRQFPLLPDGHAVELLPTGAAEVEGKGQPLPSVLARALRAGGFPPVVEVWPLWGETRGDGATLGEESVQSGYQARGGLTTGVHRGHGADQKRGGQFPQALFVAGTGTIGGGVGVGDVGQGSRPVAQLLLQEVERRLLGQCAAQARRRALVGGQFPPQQ